MVYYPLLDSPHFANGGLVDHFERISLVFYPVILLKHFIISFEKGFSQLAKRICTRKVNRIRLCFIISDLFHF
jgi:hypothetical protein